MSRKTYVYRDGQLVEKHLAAPIGENQSAYVISDSMDTIRSMADGQLYDSKSAYRKNLRANGCYEMGNDAPREARGPETPSNVKRDVANAMKQLGML